ncbi:MAG: hypothetical protein CML69_15440 [Rhodobacteraceae bacterium]|nr:hypothetical protein [Paracoccaceae bacterium]
MPPDFAETGLLIRPGARPPARFQVIGERSSGTNYVKRLLGRNTPLEPTELLGWKHGGFQAMAVPRDLVVILSVRNARDWARSMFAKPWHTGTALQSLPFHAFLRAPWETVIDHPKYFANAGPAMLGQPLQQDRDPVTGRPYPNLFALRSGKLRTHLSLLGRDCAFVLCRHEELIANPQAFLAQFRAGLGLPVSEAPLRPVVKRLGSRFNPAVERPAPPRDWAETDLAFMRAALDMGLESQLGYRY